MYIFVDAIVTPAILPPVIASPLLNEPTAPPLFAVDGFVIVIVPFTDKFEPSYDNLLPNENLPVLSK